MLIVKTDRSRASTPPLAFSENSFDLLAQAAAQADLNPVQSPPMPANPRPGPSPYYVECQLMPKTDVHGNRVNDRVADVADNLDEVVLIDR